MAYKRERSANFASSEVRVLLQLVDKYRSTIESKKTDAQTWKQKEEVWLRLTDEFNRSSALCQRNGKTLKGKYESLKKNVKKKLSDIRDSNRSGGGATPTLNITQDEEYLLSIMGVTVDGVTRSGDGDFIEGVFLEDDNEIQDSMDTIDIKPTLITDAETGNTIIEDVQKSNFLRDDQMDRVWSQWNNSNASNVNKETVTASNIERHKPEEETEKHCKTLALMQIELMKHQIELAKKDLVLKDMEIEARAEMYKLDIERKKIEIEKLRNSI